MPPLSAHAIESPPNATKATLALVGQNAQILKLASWQGKLADVVATTQSDINQTYLEADISIASEPSCGEGSYLKRVKGEGREF